MNQSTLEEVSPERMDWALHRVWGGEGDRGYVGAFAASHTAFSSIGCKGSFWAGVAVIPPRTNNWAPLPLVLREPLLSALPSLLSFGRPRKPMGFLDASTEA